MLGEETVASLPQDTRGNVATAADGDHEVWVEVIKNALCRGLAELVHLVMWWSAGR